MENPEGDAGGENNVTQSQITEVLTRHEEEKKALKKKHDRTRSGIPRKDRVGRQRFDEEAGEEKERLAQRQKIELAEFNISEEQLAIELGKLDLQQSSPQSTSSDGPAPAKESKAARRRRKKAEQEAESRRRIEKEKQEMGPSGKTLELRAINEQLGPKRLVIYPIAADGHCLYSAIIHQMKLSEPSQQWPIELSVLSLRSATADFLERNKEEFMPFIESVQNDDQKFAEYCDELRNTAVWGGHVELQVISKVLSVVIEVYSAEAPLLTIGEASSNSSNTVLRVSFHTQYLGLGEHYNSVVFKDSDMSAS